MAKKTILSARARAAKTREYLGGISREEYNKRYDVLRLRVRAFEKGAGLARGSLNAAEILYKEARNKFFFEYYGGTAANYKPTVDYEAIIQAPATTKTLSEEQKEEIEQASFARVDRQFYGVVYRSKFSADIQREFEAAQVDGTLTPRKYEQIVRKHADALEAERRQIRQFNRSTPDPSRERRFQSQ